MRIALVHELLTMKGGAERVLRILADMFPDAPIYTLLYDADAVGDWFPRERVRTSSLQQFAGLTTNHHWYLPWFPRAVEAWDFSKYDLVLSSSSAFVHGIITNGAPRHICYVQSPARYLWDRTHEILDRAGTGILGMPRRWLLSSLFHRLRQWDAEVSDRPDMLLAASATVQRRIEQYWRRESTVLHPPIDDSWLEQSTGSRTPETRDPYYLIVSTLAPYKRIDLAIQACNARKSRLIVAGAGPALASLKRIAGPTIEFIGFKTDDELRTLYADARATLFPGEEDFGLVPLESMACGTPVIAYAHGGALETIVEGKTGAFFPEPGAESLMNAMDRFEHLACDPAACRKHASEFGRSAFETKLQEIIKRVAAHDES